ncbi:MAG: T9SS type A sorting domain-containing protein, partial [Bacteroidetes bacterium]|nr:T9SS type A sorting domain-containing protein [Bacteroidota bacterium]
DDNAGTPGSVLSTATVPISTITTDISNTTYTTVDFNPNVSISGPFYISVVLPTNGDTVAIYTNQDGEATANTAWEEWTPSGWYAYNDGSSWELSLNHMIYVIACGQAGVLPPSANFQADQTTVLVGSTVNFTDLSTGSPTSWSWTFSGGSPNSSTSQNQAVIYNTAGVFDVSLTATNTDGSDTETKAGYITVLDQPAGCDTVTNFTGTPTLYTTGQGGYLAGNNGYGDLSKAEYFDNLQDYTSLDATLIGFGAATGTSSTITINVRSESGGSPGAVIGSATIPISTIVTNVGNSELTTVDFNPDISLSGAFFIEVVLPTAAGDTVAIVTNVSGEATTNTGWETWDNGTWYAYDDGSSWGIALNHLWYAVVCTGGVGISSEAMSTKVSVFPNPSTGEVYIYLGNANVDNANIKVYSLFGKVISEINRTEMAENMLNLDFSTLSNGMYVIHIETPSGKVVKKVTITR